MHGQCGRSLSVESFHHRVKNNEALLPRLAIWPTNKPQDAARTWGYVQTEPRTEASGATARQRGFRGRRQGGWYADCAVRQRSFFLTLGPRHMSETLEQDARDTLWVTDEELIRRLGAPRKAVRAALYMFDRDLSKGFPQKQALWGNRRYWPAVKAYLDRTNGLNLQPSNQPRRVP